MISVVIAICAYTRGNGINGGRGGKIFISRKDSSS